MIKIKSCSTVGDSNNAKVDKDEVKKSLINHDGYEPDIRVTKARKNKSAYSKLIG